ncbi:1926_t:CDS:1, partial [Racocetra fulgida]
PPKVYDFKHIKKKKKTEWVFFDKAYQHCEECKRNQMLCDREKECVYCRQREKNCLKLKSVIRKKILKNNKGQRYISLIESYWSGFGKLYLKHYKEIEDIEKHRCN